MQRTLAVAGAAAAPFVLVHAAAAGPVNFYDRSFEGAQAADLPEWSGFVLLANNETLTRFMGPSAQRTTTLTIDTADEARQAAAAAAPGQFTMALMFDLYIIDSWGNSAVDPGDDYFRVYHGGGTVFEEIFSNTIGVQTFRAPDERGSYAYNPIYDESIYRDVRIDFALPAEGEQIRFDFIANTTLPWQDESYGIDNVRVGYEVVPAPGPIALLGIGGLVLARRQR